MVFIENSLTFGLIQFYCRNHVLYYLTDISKQYVRFIFYLTWFWCQKHFFHRNCLIITWRFGDPMLTEVFQTFYIRRTEFRISSKYVRWFDSKSRWKLSVKIKNESFFESNLIFSVLQHFFWSLISSIDTNWWGNFCFMFLTCFKSYHVNLGRTGDWTD